MDLTRRDFLKLAGAAAVSGNILSGRVSEAFTGQYATIIDLTRCDGCRDLSVPLCVNACREYNATRFPEPIKNIPLYWPHKFYEDWSKKRGLINTLTPYNWIFVQKVHISGTTLFVPRRCMHCDNPPCVALCPFGALSKERAGNTVISDRLCFGGAKCRDVCPWHIPQRQAGVGLYLKIMPTLAGGGVMYKCDLCNGRITAGQEPACVLACKQRLKDKPALFFGRKDEILAMARSRSRDEGLYLYGDSQNGGTSTIYLSDVPFSTIEASLKAQKERFQMAVSIPNPLDEPRNLAKYFLLSSFAAAFAGIVGALYGRKKNKTDSGT